MACHGPDEDKTVVDYLKKNALPTFLAHRLDKETSGILLVAKSKEVAAQLGELFETHQIEKYYLALSDKKGKKKQGTIKGYMGKARKGSWRLIEKSSQPVCTQFFSFSLRAGIRLFVIKPLSGRTHQIRVALKANASPVLGDLRYGATSSVDDRMYLHAYALRFELDSTNYEFICWPDQGELFTENKIESVISELDIKQPWFINWPKTNFGLTQMATPKE